MQANPYRRDNKARSHYLMQNPLLLQQLQRPLDQNLKQKQAVQLPVMENEQDMELLGSPQQQDRRVNGNDAYFPLHHTYKSDINIRMMPCGS